jgi:hypothetical protein
MRSTTSARQRQRHCQRQAVRVSSICQQKSHQRDIDFSMRLTLHLRPTPSLKGEVPSAGSTCSGEVTTCTDLSSAGPKRAHDDFDTGDPGEVSAGIKKRRRRPSGTSLFGQRPRSDLFCEEVPNITLNDGDSRLAAVQSQHPQSNGGVQTVASSTDAGETVSIGPTSSDQYNMLHPTYSAIQPWVNYTGGLFSQLMEPILSGGYPPFHH